MATKLPTQTHSLQPDEDRPMTLADCPVRTTLDVLKGKWKPMLLLFLKPGPRRYAELRADLPDATEKVLIQQLRELEQDHIIARTLYPEVPPRVDYRITSYGETLVAILQQMAHWGTQHRATQETSNSRR